MRRDGTYHETPCREDGRYSFEGMPGGEYDLRYVSEAYASRMDVPVVVVVGETVTTDLTAEERPSFFPERRSGESPFTTGFRYALPERESSIRLWQWDFDNDGVIDSVQPQPTNTFSSIGAYTVRLVTEDTNGVAHTSVYRDCVTVRAHIPNVLNSNAFIVEEVPGLTLLALTETTLTLSGTPPFDPVAGTVISGEGGGGYLRRVVSFTRAGADWEIQTEQAGLGDLYETYSFSCNGPLSRQAASQWGYALQGLPGAPELEGSVGALEDFVESGISFGIGVNPELYLDFEARKTGGEEYLRMVIVGKIGLAGEIKASSSVVASLSESTDIPVRVNIPTPVPGLIIEPGLSVHVQASSRGTIESTINHSSFVAVEAGLEHLNGKTSRVFAFKRGAENKAEWDLNGSFNAKFSVHAFAKAKWFKVVTVELGPEIYMELGASAGLNSPGTAKAVLGAAVKGDAYIGFDVNIGWFNPRISIFSFDTGLGSIGWTWRGPKPDFYPSPSSGPSPLLVEFEDRSQGGSVDFPTLNADFPVGSYSWDFDDKTTSNLSNPTHTFANKGLYFVTLRVSGAPINSPMVKALAIRVGEQEEPPGPKEDDDNERGRPVQSADPNEMAGPLGFGDPIAQRFVRPGQWMDYIVYFENQTNATAAAQEVWVDAHMSPYLDWSTLELGEVVFSNQLEMGLAGKRGGEILVAQTGTPYHVKIRFTLDPASGHIQWYLRSHDSTQALTGFWPADPTAGFLAPNDPTNRGEGHLAYRIKVRHDAPAGARINASADITFDYNPIIPTNPSWWNTVYGNEPGPPATLGLAGPDLAGQMSIEWQASAGTTYQVMRATVLDPTAFQPAPSGPGPYQSSRISALLDGIYRYRDPSDPLPGAAFYKVESVSP